MNPKSSRGLKVCVVSLNPAVDVEWRVQSVVPGEKNEVTSERRWPGGKGINVARWLKWHGASPRLVLPLGGVTGEELAEGLRAEKLPFESVRISQPSRANVVVTPEVGTQLRFNPTWPVLTAREVRRLLATIEESWRAHDAVVLSGSLARGARVDTYAALIRAAHQVKLPVFLDCDGAAFRRGVGARPSFVKPNAHELAVWARRDLQSKEDFCGAARGLAAATGGWVLASHGAEGAFLIEGQSKQEFYSPAVRVRKVRNTVGAGDAMLAGVVASYLTEARPHESGQLETKRFATAGGQQGDDIASGE